MLTRVLIFVAKRRKRDKRRKIHASIRKKGWMNPMELHDINIIKETGILMENAYNEFIQNIKKPLAEENKVLNNLDLQLSKITSMKSIIINEFFNNLGFVFSNTGKTKHDLTNAGEYYELPYDINPDNVICDDIVFKIQQSDTGDNIICNGQIISVNEQEFLLYCVVLNGEKLVIL